MEFYSGEYIKVKGIERRAVLSLRRRSWLLIVISVDMSVGQTSGNQEGDHEMGERNLRRMSGWKNT